MIDRLMYLAMAIYLLACTIVVILAAVVISPLYWAPAAVAVYPNMALWLMVWNGE